MKWPGPHEWLFSLKAFAAAMLAFWIACAWNLPRPAWAIFTVYTLMQPVSGAVRSKAVFRMLGTVAGSMIALLLVALLANLPGALFLAAGLVALGGVFLSMVDQMPRGYSYLMAGTTVAIIVLPDALDPLSSFATAMARTEESLLGIACATLVDSLFFPHPAGTVLNEQVAGWLEGARDYTLRALDGSSSDHTELGALAVGAAQLDALASHVAYDIVANRPSPRTVRLLHTRMLLLIRLMFGAHDWSPMFCPGLGAGSPLGLAVGALREWVGALPDPSPARTAAALRAIEDARAEASGRTDAGAALDVGLGLMLRNLMLGCQDCLALQSAVTRGAPLPDHLRRAAWTERLSIPYRDPTRALLVLLPVGLAFLLVVGYAAATGWDQGQQAALMTLVAGALASTSPEPTAQVLRVLAIMAVAASVAIAYQFAVLPAVQDFPLLVAALGLFLLPAGAFIPITSGTGLLLTVLTSMMLSLQPEYDAQFIIVADGALGTLAGLAAAALLARLSHVPGTAWTTRHLLRAGWSDLAALAERRWQPDPAAYALRALDRFTVLAPQLDAPEQDHDLTSNALMGELRIGLNILQLREAEADLPAPARAATEAMLQALARYFGERRRGRQPPIDTVLGAVAATMTATVAAMPSPTAQTAWLMVAGVQRSLTGPIPAAETAAADAR